MNKIKVLYLIYILCFTFLGSCTPSKETTAENNVSTINHGIAADPLPSWNDGQTKKRIMNYVSEAINPNGLGFVPVSDRIATFDMDGTLWSEQPHYFEYLFAVDMLKAMAPNHPEWKTTQPFKAVLENDTTTLRKLGGQVIYDVVKATHSGMTTDEFALTVEDWAKTAKNPTKDKLYTELVFQPMLELMDYLRANGFITFIVSGSGIEFMRPWTEKVYGIPPYQVIGSTGLTKYDFNNGNPVIHRLSAFDNEVDNVAKPEAIDRHIGLKPVFAVGNSNGDLEMLRWADSNPLNSFKMYVHHTDSIREWAYDRNSPIGTLDKGLDYALEKGWSIADMEKDWKIIYPFNLTK